MSSSAPSLSDMATELELAVSVPLRSPAQSLAMTPASSTASSTPPSTDSAPYKIMSFDSSTQNNTTAEANSIGNAATASKNQSQSRRPPRKSTLTQQQKNQKRQRATPDQLSALEIEFNKNPTPPAEVRDRIADQINMTERSVQIWFQNRRAKIKLMAKRSLETGEDIDSIPESMRQYLAMQALETGKGPGSLFLTRTGLSPYSPFYGDGLPGKVVIHHMECGSLRIGTWTRIAQSQMDLIIFASPGKSTMTYYIHTDHAGYKIEYPFSLIKSIQLDNAEGDPSKMSGITIELTAPPFFFMDSSPAASGFVQVSDFTENVQASNCLVHYLGGNPKRLSTQLAKLVSLEAFQQRHHHSTFLQPPTPMSAPVSPIPRPSSQPNFVQPHMGFFQEPWGMMPPPPIGRAVVNHKRQRSRSVPGPVDFSMFQTQMPSFYIQSPGDLAAPHHSHHHQPDIYAPIPQQPITLGPNLRIDTHAGFGLDTRHYSVSATTAPSPAESYSPQFYPPDSGAPLSANFNPSYNGAYLTAMAHPSGLMSQSVSPLSFASHGEPSIVEHSPPMSLLGRPGSVDIYTIPDGSCAVSDDGTGLNEMYSKHTITLPLHPHSPAFLNPSHADLHMPPLTFDTVDSGSLSPETIS